MLADFYERGHQAPRPCGTLSEEVQSQPRLQFIPQAIHNRWAKRGTGSDSEFVLSLHS